MNRLHLLLLCALLSLPMCTTAEPEKTIITDAGIRLRGNRSYYRLTDENGAVNFFKIRTAFINKYLEDTADSSGN